jgi:hypothetical protein
VSTAVRTDGSAARTRAGRLGRHRATLVIGAGVVVALVVALLLGGQGSSERAAPDNPGRDGGKALAQVLGDQGVQIDVVRSSAELARAGVDDRTTVLVTSTEHLGADAVRRVRSTTSGSLLVLLQPPPWVAEALGAAAGSPVGGATRTAGCRGEGLADRFGDLRITTDDAVGYPAVAGCWFVDDAAVLAAPDDRTVLLGAADLLLNQRILQADNAAAALRLLGQHPRLVWFVPTTAELVDSDTVTLSTLLPPWLRPGLWMLALAIGGVLLWRLRRLGPLATEPLPVVVKAVETTLSRGRLYRKVDDRGHAASQLRAATRRRLAERLRSPSADPDALVRDVARQAGRPLGEVAFLLHPDAPVPGNDHDLITLAGQLATLEKEVRRG